MMIKTQNVLITGGAGFIGSQLAERLISENIRVTIFDNFNNFYNPAWKRQNIEPLLNHDNCLLVEGDIRNGETLNQCFAANHFDLVVHLAAMAGVRPSLENPDLYYDVNINGTRNVFEAMRKYDVKRCLAASSSSVYGNNKKTPFAESDPVDHPISPYAFTKKTGELMAYNYHYLYDLSICCFRFFTVYGPRQRPDMAIAKFVDTIDNNKKITLFGDGSNARDYTFIDDILDGLMKAVELDFAYDILNLGNSHPVKLSTLVEEIEAVMNKTAIKDFKPMSPGDVDHTFADITKAKKILGYNPQVHISDGLKQFVSWYYEQRSLRK